MSGCLLLLVFLPILVGASIYKIQDEKKLWIITTIFLALTTIISFTLINQVGLSISLPLFGGLGIGFSVNELGCLYTIIASFCWLVSAVCSREYFIHHAHNLNRYYSALLITYGATLGVFLAEDLFSIFVFFEVMSFASYVWVAHNQDEKSRPSSDSYLAFAVFGGLVMLFGLFILYSLCPDLSLHNLSTNFANFQGNKMLLVACFFMFVGFGTKAGAFFLHDWLPLAHTASPAPASGLLSGLLTKTGIYGVILITIKIVPYSEVFTYFILVISMFNMLGGAIFAFISTNLKRTLAFSSVSQIGFILWGVACISLLQEHNAIAVYGTVFYMINHSLIKILLFSLAGVVYQNAHTLDLNELEGFGKDKLWLKIAFAVGAISLAGVPLLSGYVSKTLLHEAMVEYMHLFHAGSFFKFAEYLFLVSGGFTLAYMYKLFNCLFMKEPKENVKIEEYVTTKTKIALSTVAIILVILGLTPTVVFASIGEFVSHFFHAHALEEVAYFSFVNLKGSATSIIIGILIYVFSCYIFPPKEGKAYYTIIGENVSVEELIYKPLFACLSFVFAIVFRVLDIVTDLCILVIRALGFKEAKIPSEFFGIARIRHYSLRPEFHLSYTLAYSLLMFGFGFLFTIIYLLVVGSI